MEQVDVLMGLIAKLRSEVKEKVTAVFYQIIEAEFKANPAAEAVTVCMWRPHFNDGEPCLFELHKYELCTKLPMEDDGTLSVDVLKYGSDNDDAEEDVYSTYIDPMYYNAMRELIDETFEDSVGEGCHIFLRDGTYIHEEVDHD
jgi:hypothetical protein